MKRGSRELEYRKCMKRIILKYLSKGDEEVVKDLKEWGLVEEVPRDEENPIGLRLSDGGWDWWNRPWWRNG